MMGWEDSYDNWKLSPPPYYEDESPCEYCDDKEFVECPDCEGACEFEDDDNPGETYKCDRCMGSGEVRCSEC